MDTKIIFVGAHYTESFRQKYNVDSLYRDDEAIVVGLRQLVEGDIEVWSCPDVGSFPSVKPLHINGYYDSKEDTHIIGFWNIPCVKHILQPLSIYFTLRERIKNVGNQTTFILPYMVFHHIFGALLLKNTFGNRVKVCLIVPDVFFPKSRVGQIFKSLEERIARSFDSFVLYTEPMADYLQLKDKKNIVIEGFHKVDVRPTETPKGKFIITYAGSLNICYGMGRLLDAFRGSPQPDMELHLYGRGDADALIKERAASDSRIKYYGLVPKEEATEALYKSSLLINPRNANDGEYVQYSFPSKDIDYLASGVPCVLCKLPGMPQEYYGHFIDANDGTAEDLAAAIMNAYNMSSEQRTELAQKAQQFIIERMDTKKQAERILEMINS